MSEADLREAWRRRKRGEPLEERHAAAQREDNRRRAAETSQVSLPLDARSKAGALAKAKGVTVPVLVAQLVRLEASGELIERKSHEAIVAEHAKKLLRVERQYDDQREHLNDLAERVRTAENAARAATEELLASHERMISFLDLHGVPDVDGDEFLAPSDSHMTTGSVLEAG